MSESIVTSDSIVTNPKHRPPVDGDLYERLLQSRQKSNRDKEDLRRAIAEAVGLLKDGDVANATALLQAAYDATRLIVLKSTDGDCGCGG